MKWLDDIVDQFRNVDKEVLVSSGASPSGVYHVGHLREIVIADAVVRVLKQAGIKARHVHVSDNLDAFRKVPVNLPASYEQYLGMPLYTVPSPDDQYDSWGDFCLKPFLESADKIGITMDVVYASDKYRSGFFVPAIERSLSRIDKAKSAIQEVSGRQLDDQWSPIQIMEHGRLKNRQFIRMDSDAKTITYRSHDDSEHTVRYDDGQVKLDWRLDWPGRWWLLGVDVEPFGRDHATKGGSYDTGKRIAREVYDIDAPVPVPYEFINRTGDTKKMSASKGTGVNAHDVVDMLPPEVVRYFILRYSPAKRLYFDETDSLVRLVDDFAAMRQHPQNELDERLLFLCTDGLNQPAVSSVPFSHLVISYQAALCDTAKTVEILRRSAEYADIVDEEETVIITELDYVIRWLDQWAPESLKFRLADEVNPDEFSAEEKEYLRQLADDIAEAPAEADGNWFHQAIYAYKESGLLPPRELFTTVYRALIGKDSGPRAGWFLSILPRDWLIDRLRLLK